MDTQPYKANLEAIQTLMYMSSWLLSSYLHIDNAYRLGIVVYSKLNKRTSHLSN